MTLPHLRYLFAAAAPPPPVGGLPTKSYDTTASRTAGYMTRTYTNAGNRRLFTVSLWVKFSVFNFQSHFFACRTPTGNSEYQSCYAQDDQPRALYWSNQLNNYANHLYVLDKWHHIVWQFDSDNATNADRSKYYFHGVFAARSSGGTCQTGDQGIGGLFEHRVGISPDNNNGPQALIYNFQYFDGVHVDPTDLGQGTPGDIDDWYPKLYNQNYGITGCWLKFENAGDLGEDSSGNANGYLDDGNGAQSNDIPPAAP